MRKLLLGALALGLFAAACMPDFPGVTELDNAATKAAESGQVAEVNCTATVLDLATRETAACTAFNQAGTRISVDGTNVVPTWRSTDNSVVSVDLTGGIQAESIAGSAWIVAEGTYGSADSIQVSAQ